MNEEESKVNDDEDAAVAEKKPHWKEKKGLLISIVLMVLLLIAIGVFYLYQGTKTPAKPPVNMSLIKDLGAVRIRGDGLPGYDINGDGKVDYIATGFGYYKGLYNSGGFEYGPGGIELKEFGVNITLPTLLFKPEEIVESGVGSVVMFNSTDETSKVTVRVILKTLGPALSTYTLIIETAEGGNYIIIDTIDGKGGGVFEEKEVEIAGRVVFRE